MKLNLRRLVHISFLIRIVNFTINLQISGGFLLYPPSTVFQIIASLSVPVKHLEDNHKILFDWGFQMNYNMPSNLSQFYMIPIWFKSARNNYHQTNFQLSTSRKSFSIHPNDYKFTEFYAALESLLQRYKYDKTCLLWSICNLAGITFGNRGSNFLSDIIEFILKPSALQLIATTSLYHAAEFKGFLGHNCTKLYPHCQSNFSEIF